MVNIRRNVTTLAVATLFLVVSLATQAQESSQQAIPSIYEQQDLPTSPNDLCGVEKGYDFSLKGQGLCVVHYYLLHVATNNEKSRSANLIENLTQKEVQEWIRFLHYYKISPVELLKLKISLNQQTSFQEMAPEIQAEMEKTINDTIKIMERMDQFRKGESEDFPGQKMHCRFALYENPAVETPKMVFMANPSLYMERQLNAKALQNTEIIQTLLKHSAQKAIVGFCWDDEKKDRINKKTELL